MCSNAQTRISDCGTLGCVGLVLFVVGLVSGRRSLG